MSGDTPATPATPVTATGNGADRNPAPVLILGCHRSGTSAVAGLLVTAAGMRIGEPLPPTAANPKGYYESAVVVKAHNDALARLDRDWSCPPSELPPDPLASEMIGGEVASLAAEPGPWGVKDPRLLFTLPLWCDVVGHMRLLGVVRDHEEVARSIMARDKIRAAQADAIVRAHVRRLRLLRDRFEFPVVDFSADDFLSSMRTAATALDLDWDARAAQQFFDADLPTERGEGYHTNVDLQALRARRPVEHAPVLAADEVRRGVTDVARTEIAEHGHVTRLSLHSGLRAAMRRKRLWALVPDEAHDTAVELTRDDRLATRAAVVPGAATAHEVESLAGAWRALARTDDDVSALVAGDFASWLPPNQLPAFLGLVAETLPAGTALVLAISEADRIEVRRRGHEAITFDELVAVLEDDHRVVKTGGDQLLAWVTAVVRDRPRQLRGPQQIPFSEWDIDWKARHDQLQAAHEQLRREHDQLRRATLVAGALKIGRAAGPVVRALRRVRGGTDDG